MKNSSLVTPEKVIAPATPFENLVDSVVKSLKEVPNMSNENFTFVVAGVAFGFLLLMVFIFKKPKSVKETENVKAPATKKVSKKEK